MTVRTSQGMQVTAGDASDVADTLESAAVGLPLAGRLADLAEALRDLDDPVPDTTRARHWSSVDMFGVFLGDGNDPEAAGPRGRFSRILGIVVPVLVFIPIAWTWVGLAWASEAYRSAATAGTLRGESFLQGWETGFGGRLPGLLVFDKLAFGTVVLVVLLIVATAIHGYLNRRFEEHQAGLRYRLTDALLRAELLLAPYRLPAPEQAALDIDAAAAGLADTVSAIEAAGEAAASAQAQASDAIGAVTTALAAAERAMSSADSAANALEAAPGRLAEQLVLLATAAARVAKAESDLADATGRSSDRIAGALEDGAGQVRTSVDTLSATAAGYVSRAEVAADILGQAQQAIEGLPAVVTALQAEVGSLGGQLASLQQVTRAVADLRLSLDALRQSLDTTQRAAGTRPAAARRRGLLARVVGRG